MAAWCCWCCCHRFASAEKLFTALNKTWLVFADYQSQPAARARCQQRGGELATVESVAEQALMQGEVTGLFNTGFWIGLQARGVATTNKGLFTWFTLGRAPIVDVWSPGEPNNVNSIEGVCAEQRVDRTWNDLRCDYPLPSLCQLGG